MNDKSKINRKEFLKGLGIAGIATAFPMLGCKKEGKTEPLTGRNKPVSKVPKRPLGKTGASISSLSHGIMYNLVENQSVLYKGLQLGVDCWDTSHGYAGGYSELGIGKYLKRNPHMRKNLFIVSKASGAWNPGAVERRLQTSLKRMNTSYIDLYYGVHGLSDPRALSPGLRRWAEKAKKRGVIKYFGFSSHKNMATCLLAASKLDWIDAILTSYNFRLMQDSRMQDAVEACHQKGIGLIAMKLLALKVQSEGDQDLIREFIKKGLTEGQAKIKAVLGDKRISSVCISMANTALIATNASAIIERELSSNEMDFLKQYALNSRASYCTGCAEICDRALPDFPVVSDIMRYLMYFNNYGEEQKARRLFREISTEIRNKIKVTDFQTAESLCPQRLPIRKLIGEAMIKLA